MEMEMDAAVITITSTDQLRHCKSTSHRSLVGSPPSLLSSRGAHFEPMTPDSNRESVDCRLNSTSKLHFDKDKEDDAHICSPVKDGSPCTPRKDVLFDPFAPGPHKLLNAPYARKYDKESRVSVTRQLSFSSCSKVSTKADAKVHDKMDVPEEDMMLFEAVYLSIMDAIISAQTTEANAEVSDLDSDSDGFRTPTSAPHLSGVADTCPRAPVKPTNKFRSFDNDICRKLEF